MREKHGRLIPRCQRQNGLQVKSTTMQIKCGIK